jgi:hypothetical protein
MVFLILVIYRMPNILIPHPTRDGEWRVDGEWEGIV